MLVTQGNREQKPKEGKTHTLKKAISGSYIVIRLAISGSVAIFLLYVAIHTSQVMDTKGSSSFLTVFLSELPVCFSNVFTKLPLLGDVLSFIKGLVSDKEKNFVLFIASFVFTLSVLVFFCHD